MNMPARFIVLVISFSTAASVSGQDALLNAVKARQDATKSVDARIHVKEFVAKGSYSGDAASMPGGKKGVVIPAQDTTLESANRLVIDGIKVRFEKNHPMWHLPDGVLHKAESISVTNGELSKVFHPSGIGPDPEVIGIIRSNARNDGIQSYLIVPFTQHFRGTDPGIATYHPQSLKKTGRTLPFDGVACDEYEATIASDRVASFWYEPMEGYLLRRIQKRRLGIPYEQYDIQYQQTPGFGPTPQSWVRTEYDAAGKVRKAATATVTDIQINAKVDDGEFEMIFPPGTHVHDQRLRKEYRVQASGDMRELDPYGRETGDPIPQPGVSWFSRNRWLAIALGVLLLSCVLMAVWRLWKRRSASNAQPG